MSDYNLVVKAKIILTVNDFIVEDYITSYSKDFFLGFNERRIVLRDFNPIVGKSKKYLAVDLHCRYVGPSNLCRGIFEAFIIDFNSKQRFFRKQDITVGVFGTTAVCPLISLKLLKKSVNKLFPENVLNIGANITLYLRTSHLENSFDYRKSFNVKELSDLKIICGHKEFYASKALLMSNSEVFRRMLSTDMKEQMANELVIEDIDEEVFEEFLKFLYFYNSDKLEELKEELLYISEKYEVLKLKAICEDLLFFGINPKNAIKLLKIFDKFNCIEVKNKTIDFIARNLSSIRRQTPNDWMDLLKSDYHLTDHIIKAMSDIIETTLNDFYEPTSLQLFINQYISY